MEAFGVDVAAEPVQNFNEPAHMCPFEVMGQIDVHVDSRDGLLDFLGLVQHRDGVGNILNPYFSNIDPPVIRLALDVLHGVGREQRFNKR